MPIEHREIPILPACPRTHPISAQLSRSYPVGRQSFSRAYQGAVLQLTITAIDPLPENVLACLLTTLNSHEDKTRIRIPFVCANDRTLTCSIVPESPGLHSFRAEFSLDNGITWLRDTVQDAWVLIDPPQLDGLRFYTLIPTVSGTLADWKADLPRINKMGFNAVHLLPITRLDTSESPYAARDLFDIDSSYLIEGSSKDGLSQLEEFVEEAKILNIHLCFDLVLNHVGVNSTIAQRAPDWIVPDLNQEDGLQRARYWTNEGWLNWNDLVLINYEHPSEAIRSEIWGYMTDYALFWAKLADYTKGFVRFDNLHSSNPAFAQALAIALHREYPQVGILAEYFTDEVTLLHNAPLWGLNLVLATPWNARFVPLLRDYLNYIHRVSEQIRYYMPITSHDCGSPAVEFGSVDSTIPRYVAAALLGTGATGIPQGVEFGEKERIQFIGRKPKMQYPAEAKFATFIGKVNAILADYPAFRQGKNCQFIDNGHASIIAAFRQDTGAQSIGFLVVCNFDTLYPQKITLDPSSFLGTNGPITSCELLSDQVQIFPNYPIELLLPSCTAQVFMFPKNKELT